MTRRRRLPALGSLAGLVGRSADWLKKIETGVRPLNSLPLLIELARILGVDDLSELTGNDFNAPIRAWEKDVHHVVPAIRRARRSRLPGAPDAGVAAGSHRQDGSLVHRVTAFASI
jgi:Helix-turn-helix domain